MIPKKEPSVYQGFTQTDTKTTGTVKNPACSGDEATTYFRYDNKDVEQGGTVGEIRPQSNGGPIGRKTNRSSQWTTRDVVPV